MFQRFCMLDQKYVEPYQKIFVEQYEAIHRLESNKLRNVAKFFAHLLFTDAISWEVGFGWQTSLFSSR
jgi:pre-mRNA-splicing factor CWC22